MQKGTGTFSDLLYYDLEVEVLIHSSYTEVTSCKGYVHMQDCTLILVLVIGPDSSL